MFTKPLVFLIPALAVAVAQNYGGPPAPAPSAASGSSSPSPTSSALAVAPTAPASTATQMNIDVAFNETFVFNPPNITANVGTLVTFYFPNFGLNHSVTQSNFADPCTYLAANTTTNAPAGFDSGLLSASTFTINITDTNPIWYFCKQVTHCGKGMVGSINAVGDTYTTFLNAAKAIGANEVPAPSDTGAVVAGVDATATGPPVPDLTASAAASGAMKVTTSIGFALFAAVAIAMAMA